MSMQCWLLALTAPQVDAVIGSPELASVLVEQSEAEAASAARADALSKLSPEMRQALEASYAEAQSELSATLGQQPPESGAEGRLAGLGERAAPIELGHFWHVLHFLLTGHADDAAAPGNVLLTGRSIGEDVGYGPPRLSTSVEVAASARFLSAMALEAISQRVDLHGLRQQDLYGVPRDTGRDAEEAPLVRDEVLEAFRRLKGYVSSAATRRDALLVWIS